MKRIGILLAAVSMSGVIGVAAASAQYRPIEKVHRYYSDSSYQHQTGTVIFYCDGGQWSDGGEITTDLIEDYYGC